MPTLKRQIDPTLKAAILNYFAKKFHDGSGIFKEGEKEPCLQQIREACQSLGFGWEVVPGLIIIHFDNGDSLWFDDKNKHVGKMMPKNTKDPLDYFYNKGRKKGITTC